MQGYCDFLTEEELVRAVEVGHVMLISRFGSPLLQFMAVVIIDDQREDITSWGDGVNTTVESHGPVNGIVGFRAL